MIVSLYIQYPTQTVNVIFRPHERTIASAWRYFPSMSSYCVIFCCFCVLCYFYKFYCVTDCNTCNFKENFILWLTVLLTWLVNSELLRACNLLEITCLLFELIGSLCCDNEKIDTSAFDIFGSLSSLGSRANRRVQKKQTNKHMLINRIANYSESILLK